MVVAFDKERLVDEKRLFVMEKLHTTRSSSTERAARDGRRSRTHIRLATSALAELIEGAVIPSGRLTPNMEIVVDLSKTLGFTNSKGRPRREAGL